MIATLAVTVLSLCYLTPNYLTTFAAFLQPIAVGAGLHHGTETQKITHYSLLRTLEDGFHLNPLGAAARTTGIGRLGG